MDDEVHSHDEKDGDEKWIAFTQGCIFCSYRERYWKLMQVEQRLSSMPVDGPEFEPLTQWYIRETKELLTFGNTIMEECDKGKRRQIEALLN